MTSEELCHEAQGRIGHQFGDPSTLRRALTHASVADCKLSSNERLEFLGDSVLGLVACELVFEMYPSLLEGEMTKIKSTVVSRQTCAAISKELGLDKLLQLGKGMKSSAAIPQSLAAAVLESIIAAVYLDGGIEASRRFLGPILRPLIEQAADSGHQENFKSVLQQHSQLIFDDSPSYVVLDEKGPDHSKCFEVCVEIGARRFRSSWGQTKKQAEQQAALYALEALGVVTEEPNGRVRVRRETPPPCPRQPSRNNGCGTLAPHQFPDDPRPFCLHLPAQSWRGERASCPFRSPAGANLRTIMLRSSVRRGLLSAAAMLGFVVAPAVADTSPTLLTWNKGTKLHYRWSEESTNKTSSGPTQVVETQNGRTSTVTWEVMEVASDGSATIKMTYNAFAIVAQLPRTTDLMRFDSLSPQATDTTNPLATVYGPIVGESVTFTIDRTGLVSNVAGMKELAAKLRAASRDTPGAGTFNSDIQESFSDARLKKNIERIFSGGTDKMIKEGETWTDSLDLPLPRLGSMKAERTHTLKSLSKSAAVIDVAIKLSLNVPADDDQAKATFSMMNPKLTDGNGSGSRRINLEKGWLEESKVSLTVPIEMNIPGQPDAYKLHMNINLKIERLDGLPAGAVIPGVTPPPAPKPAAPVAPAPKPVDPNVNLTPRPAK